jgi:drug/metabolite transporter (DMT)-like permease
MQNLNYCSKVHPDTFYFVLGEEDLEDHEDTGRWTKILILTTYGFFVSTMSFYFLLAIPYMPIGDLIVLSFKSPVFSVFLDRVVLKRPLTFLAVFLCMIIIVGDFLVVKPPIIFGDGANDNVKDIPKQIFTYLSLLLTKGENASSEQGNLYYLGVALCVYTAFAGSVTNVAAAKSQLFGVSSSFLMLISGSASLVLSLLSSTFLTNRLLTSPLSLPLEAAVMLPVIAVLTILAYWTITKALSITRNPTLIAMLRSTEILISLVTEALYWHQKPGVLPVFGSVLVSICVLAMAGHDKIHAVVSRQLKRKQSEISLISQQVSAIKNYGT